MFIDSQLTKGEFLIIYNDLSIFYLLSYGGYRLDGGSEPK